MGGTGDLGLAPNPPASKCCLHIVCTSLRRSGKNTRALSNFRLKAFIQMSPPLIQFFKEYSFRRWLTQLWLWKRAARFLPHTIILFPRENEVVQNYQNFISGPTTIANNWFKCLMIEHKSAWWMKSRRGVLILVCPCQDIQCTRGLA